MTILQLIYFEAVARNKSVSLAAQELFVSPSAISKSLSNLKTILNIELYIKQKNGVLLTTQGKIFLKGVKPLLKDYHKLMSSLKSSEEIEELSIGFPFIFTYSPLDRVYSSLKKELPNLSIKIQRLTFYDIFDLTKKDILSLGIIFLPEHQILNLDKDFNYIKLQTVQPLLGVNKNSVFSGNSVTVNDIENINILSFEDRFFNDKRAKSFLKSFLPQKSDLKLNLKFFSSADDIISELSFNEDIGAFFLENFLPNHEDLKFFPIEGSPPIEIFICHKKGTHLNEHVINFFKKKFGISNNINI